MNTCLWLAMSGAAALVPTVQVASGQAGVTSQRQTMSERRIEALKDTRWVLSVKPDATAAGRGERPFSDVLVFQNENVVMTACLAMGFGPSRPNLRARDGGIEVVTEQSSPTQGRTRWEAVIRNDGISGKLVWTKRGGDVSRFTFTGKESTVLEGTTWSVRFEPEGGSAAEALRASLVFAEHHLRVSDLELGSFAPSAYALKRRPGSTGALDLTVALAGTGEEILRIDAMVQGRSLAGTAELQVEEDDVQIYTISGTLKRDAATVVTTKM